MLLYTFLLFIALRLLGLLFFLWTGAVTALIPNFIADVFLACFLFAIKPSWRKNAMHAGVALALLFGLMGLIMGISGIYSGLFGPEDAQVRWLAVLEQFVMAALCLGYLALGVRSFIAARRDRQEGDTSAMPAQSEDAAFTPTDPAQEPRIDPEP